MSVLQVYLQRRQCNRLMQETVEYLYERGFTFTADPERGWWLKDGETMRYVEFFSDLRGWADYLTNYFCK